MLPGTADPESPEEVTVSRPSDILEAQAAAESAFTELFLGLGAVAGVAIGAAVTAGYATLQGWQIIIPPTAIVGGITAALVIGVIAGLYPAMRAAQLSPTEALRS